MGLNERLGRLEKKAGIVSDPLPLADGGVHRARPGDRLDALLATIEGSEHPLHDPLSRLSPEAEDDAKELAELLEALGAYDGDDEPEQEEPHR